MHYVMDYLRPNQKVMRDRAWAKQKLHSVKASAILIVLIIGVRYALCSLIHKIWGAERRHIKKEEFWEHLISAPQSQLKMLFNCSYTTRTKFCPSIVEFAKSVTMSIPDFVTATAYPSTLMQTIQPSPPLKEKKNNKQRLPKNEKSGYFLRNLY